MTKHLALFSLGILMLLGGIFAMDLNLYLGIAVMGAGAILAYWSKAHLLVGITRWAVQKGEQAKLKRAQRKMP